MSFCSQRGRGPLYNVTSCLADWSHVPGGGGGGILSGGLCPGELGQGDPLAETPPYGHKKAVRIILFNNAFLFHVRIHINVSYYVIHRLKKISREIRREPCGFLGLVLHSLFTFSSFR